MGDIPVVKRIDTDQWSKRWRDAGLDVGSRRVLVTNFSGTEQEPDLQEPPNCSGFGRIRHFRRATSPGWPLNPLPIYPASKALGMKPGELLRAQAFQNAVCNWRCWYCFVPFNLLSANRNHSQWLSAAELLDLYLEQPDPPQVIDLTGGQPDLTPEWVPWMIQEIQSRNLDDRIYLWSDDNLSTDYFWRYLSDDNIELIRNAKNYGRVCCFKGFDEESFTFNTLADGSLFDRQFDLFRRFLELGIDVYAYVTLTSPTGDLMPNRIGRFVDKLQSLHPNLPLRTVPLEIRVFTPVRRRLGVDANRALEIQNSAVETWNKELEDRYTLEERSSAITEVSLKA